MHSLLRGIIAILTHSIMKEKASVTNDIVYNDKTNGILVRVINHTFIPEWNTKQKLLSKENRNNKIMEVDKNWKISVCSKKRQTATKIKHKIHVSKT